MYPREGSCQATSASPRASSAKKSAIGAPGGHAVAVDVLDGLFEPLAEDDRETLARLLRSLTEHD
jgi:hypothetical protein